MTEVTTLLRRERGRRPRCRRTVALGCTALALAALAPAALAAELQPDPSSGTTSSSLKPDAFPHAATAQPAAPTLPAAPAAAEPVAGSLAPPPLTTPPVVRKDTSPVTTPRIQVTAPPRPVEIAPVVRDVTKAPAVHPRAKPQAARTAVKQRTVARLGLPRLVTGTLAIPLVTVLRSHVPVPVVTGRRDLLPAALGLLALVATSGCMLAVAARSRREGIGA